ncbi:MAG: Hint domain-containing protein, partial [Xanthobacteraceae bacterium]
GGDGEFGDGGASFLAGGAGGIGASLDTQHNGGFGGGGGANSDSIGAGGGGGYSGGGGGEDDVGGGGGSFVAPVATDVTLTGGENADGNGSVTIALAAGAVSCYCCGTQICTDRGEVAVEDLAIGDIVLTVSGAERPIKWIGRRSYGARFVMGRSDILPICIRAGALDDKVPKRDLRISPNHAMYFENMHREGVLIEARDLVNGVSIVRVEQVEKVEYFHVELDSHDVIIAEGAFSESFIDDDSRGMFHNAHEYSELYANAAPAVARYCAPRLDQGYELEMVWRRLARRAGLAPSDERTRASDLHGSLDRVTPCIIEGWAQNPDHPEAPVCLDIFAGGQLIGQVLANCYREDLKRAGIGSGHHSFTFAPPARLAFAPDAVEVRRSLDGIALELTGRARRMVGPKQRRTRTGIPR